jgi:hypothetical protein
MILVDDLKRRRKRKQRIRELEKVLAEKWAQSREPDPEFPGEDEDVDPEARNAYYYDITQDERYELDMLLQGSLLKTAEHWGLDIPPEFFDDSEGRIRGTILSHGGKNWVRREAAKRRREWAKDWITILSPFLSALIAILGLLVALKKR